ncbi:hypothetical protein H112_03056 [Trichophyton rubrum D6]|nr:uncharacterized protein TERG_05676 [Trichophyton rubrum CBS 118892]EZF24453.1 hypothetical protein H100_03062 [Trichophyton rubrum MR850]EZF43489.1 hypothetical protein H102_03055 [Trichophyton rubrum CBS 100081]EZF54131.1 hypothetical protein H103_03069 [Trichophyton rubrum CBS 288.86]EZF64749.1 hypothetical protein H104_03049 [Trichophyton rubrum CBS 289.86]EZF86111.1 hypothetical protein H110_03062 [Trichophyton rubrum MR1448]EZF96842.1 hypothetical protein H113_03070 [Trichophyton rubr
MPRARYLGETPSPSSSRPLLQGDKDAGKSGRKSSLANSFHHFARAALQPLIRRQPDEADGDVKPIVAGAATSRAGIRSSSLPVRSQGTLNSKQSFGIQPAGVKSPEPPLPPLPKYLARGTTSNIPKPVQPAANTILRWPLSDDDRKENCAPSQPGVKPFIGYQDLKALRGAADAKGKETKCNEAPLNPSPDSDTSSQATVKATYKPGLPLPKSAARYFPWPESIAAQKAAGRSLYALDDDEGGNEDTTQMPQEMQRTIDECEKGSVEAFSRKPNLTRPRQLPKSKTIGAIHQKSDFEPEPPMYPIREGAQCYCEDPHADTLSVDKFGRVSQRSASIETPASSDTVDIKVVKIAKPYGYWLGRLVTLTNSFRYEGAFNKPDPFTGYGIPGNTLEGKAPMSVNLEDYHIKRAFMVLERACLTSEASASLAEFKEAYSRRFGRKFSQRFATEIEKGCPKSEKTGGKGEASVMDILRSVRKSFG